VSSSNGATFRSHLLRDIPFFLANGVLCGAMLMLALGRGRSRKVVALALTLPLFAVAADSVENGALACWFFGAGGDGNVRSDRLSGDAMQILCLRGHAAHIPCGRAGAGRSPLARCRCVLSA